MSQIANNYTPNLTHYQNNSLEQKQNTADIPEQLEKARPSSKSSILKTCGRIALGIATIGISELVYLAYRGIKSMIANARPAQPKEPRVAHNPSVVPAAKPRDDISNMSLAKAATGKMELPPEYKAAVDEMFNELRGQYGEKYIPQGATIKDQLGALDYNIVGIPGLKIFTAIKNSPNAVRPNDLQKIIKDAYVPMLNAHIFSKLVQEQADKSGGLGGLKMSSMVSNMLKFQPGLQDKIDTLKSEADVQQLVSDMDIRQQMIKLRGDLENTLAELGAVYGGYRTLDEGMSLLDETGNTIRSRMESYYTGNGLITNDKLVSYFKSILTPILKQNAVEKALIQKAQEMNVNLTPQSTTLLAQELLKMPENAGKFKDSSWNAQNINDNLGGTALMQAQKAGIDNAYATHAEKLAPEVRPLFRSFLEGCCFAPAFANATNETVKNMVERMQHWKNFDGSEESRKPVNDYCKQVIGDDLKMLEGVPGNTDSTGYKDNIYSTLLDDIQRNDYTINNVKISRESQEIAQQQVTTQLKAVLPNAKDQQFVSKLINQRLWESVQGPSMRGTLADGRPVNALAGGASIPYSSKPGHVIIADYKKGGPHPSYSVQVSEDKKTAQVTATLFQRIVFEEGQTGGHGMPHYGGVTLTYTFQLTLDAHEQGQSVQDVKLGQEFVPLSQMKAKKA